MKALMITITLALAPIVCFSNTNDDVANIVKQLYIKLGDTRIEMPTVEVVDSETFVAAYYPGSNRIKIEQKAIEVCQSFGEYSNDALAFILGHELTHAFQKHLDHDHNTSFLAYDKIGDQKDKHLLKAKEREADVTGAFGAFAAGYKIHKVFPGILDRLYSAYDLTDSQLSNYPALSIRNQSAVEVQKEVDNLIAVFDAGTELSIMGEFALSNQCFEMVHSKYNSIELINNMGVNYLLQAINLTTQNLDPYVYPIEISTDERLKKAKKTGDSKDLNAEEMSLRLDCIEKAQSLFSKAIELNPLNSSTVNNFAISFALNRQYHEALGLLASKRSNIDFEDFPQLLLTEAIIQLHLKAETPNPVKKLKSLSESGDNRIENLALINLNIHQGTNKELSTSNIVCEYPIFETFELLNIKPSKVESQLKNEDIQIEKWTLKNDLKSVITQITINDQSVFIVKNNGEIPGSNPANQLYTANGVIQKCMTDKGIPLASTEDGKKVYYLIK